MKATFISSKGHKVIVEPLENQTKEQLEKKAQQIMRKRGIESKLIIEP